MKAGSWLRGLVAACATAILGVAMAQSKGPDPAYAKQQDATLQQMKGNLAKSAESKIKFVDVNNCYSCHKDIKEFHLNSKHANVNCAYCHTGAENHLAKNGKADGINQSIGTRTDHAACATCHQEQFNSFATVNHESGAKLEKATARGVSPLFDKLMAPHGFTRFVLLSAHGGNFSPLEKAAMQLRDEYAGTGVQIVAFAGRQALMDLMGVMLEAARQHGVNQDVDAVHAELTETAIMLARHGALVKPEPWEPGAMGHIDTTALFVGGFKAVSANGIIGDPRGATAAMGETVIEAIAQHITAFVRAQ